MMMLLKPAVGDTFQFEVDHFFEVDGEPADPLDVADIREITHYLLLLSGTDNPEGLLTLSHSARESFLRVRILHSTSSLFDQGPVEFDLYVNVNPKQYSL